MMTNLTQLREIKAGAPDGATHVDENLLYWTLETGKKIAFTSSMRYVEGLYIYRSLSDIETIIEQADEIARLREALEVRETLLEKEAEKRIEQNRKDFNDD